MKFVSDWRALLRRAWSIRLMLLAGLLTGAEVALPLLDQFLAIPRGLFAAASGLTTGAALVARLLAQKGLSDADQQDPPLKPS